MTNKIYISLGWRCESAVRRANLYNLRKPNYETCIFDLMVTNLEGIIKCINDDFSNLFNPKYLICKEKSLLMNTYYKFGFNHETPGAEKLPGIKWPLNEDKNYYIKNNFEKFKERYKKRLQNFKKYIKDNDHIIFILERVHNKKNVLLEKLKNILKKKYPKKKFSFDVFYSEKDGGIKLHELNMNALKLTEDEKKLELNI